MHWAIHDAHEVGEFLPMGLCAPLQPDEKRGMSRIGKPQRNLETRSATTEEPDCGGRPSAVSRMMGIPTTDG